MQEGASEAAKNFDDDVRKRPELFRQTAMIAAKSRARDRYVVESG